MAGNTLQAHVFPAKPGISGSDGPMMPHSGRADSRPHGGLCYGLRDIWEDVAAGS